MASPKLKIVKPTKVGMSELMRVLKARHHQAQAYLNDSADRDEENYLQGQIDLITEITSLVGKVGK
jgi:hypothetical protein